MKNAKKIGFFVLISFLILSFAKNIVDYQRSVKFSQEYKDDYDKEKKNNIALKTKILKQKDLYEIEKMIRNKLNLSRADEVSLIIPNPTPYPTIIIPTQPPIYSQWLNLFFQIDR